MVLSICNSNPQYAFIPKQLTGSLNIFIRHHLHLVNMNTAAGMLECALMHGQLAHVALWGFCHVPNRPMCTGGSHIPLVWLVI